MQLSSFTRTCPVLALQGLQESRSESSKHSPGRTACASSCAPAVAAAARRQQKRCRRMQPRGNTWDTAAARWLPCNKCKLPARGACKTHACAQCAVRPCPPHRACGSIIWRAGFTTLRTQSSTMLGGLRSQRLSWSPEPFTRLKGSAWHRQELLTVTDVVPGSFWRRVELRPVLFHPLQQDAHCFQPSAVHQGERLSRPCFEAAWGGPLLRPGGSGAGDAAAGRSGCARGGDREEARHKRQGKGGPPRTRYAHIACL